MTRTGWALIALGVITSPIVPFFWLTIIIGAALVLANHVIEVNARINAVLAEAECDDDCGFDETPQGIEAIEQAEDFREWSCEMAEFDVRAVWPNEAGAPE